MELTAKTCTGCNAHLPATEEHFYARMRRGKREFQPTCRVCTKAKQRAYYNRESVAVAVRAKAKRQGSLTFFRARERLYRSQETEPQRDRRLQLMTVWAAANRAYVIRYRYQHYCANKEKIKAANMRYHLKHRERGRVSRASYKARSKGAAGSFSLIDVSAKIIQQSGRCYWCEDELLHYHADHFIPLKRGGTNYPENIVISCPHCNTSRKAKLPHEFIEYRQAVRA